MIILTLVLGRLRTDGGDATFLLTEDSGRSTGSFARAAPCVCQGSEVTRGPRQHGRARQATRMRRRQCRTWLSSREPLALGPPKVRDEGGAADGTTLRYSNHATATVNNASHTAIVAAKLNSPSVLIASGSCTCSIGCFQRTNLSRVSALEPMAVCPLQLR